LLRWASLSPGGEEWDGEAAAGFAFSGNGAPPVAEAEGLADRNWGLDVMSGLPAVTRGPARVEIRRFSGHGGD
jgi:hypothetical protein